MYRGLSIHLFSFGTCWECWLETGVVFWNVVFGRHGLTPSWEGGMSISCPIILLQLQFRHLSVSTFSFKLKCYPVTDVHSESSSRDPGRAPNGRSFVIRHRWRHCAVQGQLAHHQPLGVSRLKYMKNTWIQGFKDMHIAVLPTELTTENGETAVYGNNKVKRGEFYGEGMGEDWSWGRPWSARLAVEEGWGDGMGEGGGRGGGGVGRGCWWFTVQWVGGRGGGGAPGDPGVCGQMQRRFWLARRSCRKLAWSVPPF